MEESTKKFVVLESLEHGSRFFSSHVQGDDPTKGYNGETWYRILGYADSPEEARKILRIRG